MWGPRSSVRDLASAAKSLWDFHEIKYRISLQKLPSKREFPDNRLGDSHTLLRGVNKYSFALKTHILSGVDETG
jgi:hypothetical protein